MKFLISPLLILLLFTACNKKEVEEIYVPMDCTLTDWYVKSSSARHAPPERSYKYSSDGILVMTLEFDGAFEHELHYIYDEWGRLVKDSTAYTWGGYAIIRHYNYKNDLLVEIRNSSMELNENNEWVITQSDNYILLEHDSQNQIAKILNYNSDDLKSTTSYEYTENRIKRTFERVIATPQLYDKIKTTYLFDTFKNPHISLNVYDYDPIKGHENNIISITTRYEDNEAGTPTTYSYVYNSEGLPTEKHIGTRRSGDYYITYFNYDCVIRDE